MKRILTGVAILFASVLLMSSCKSGAKLEQLGGTWEVVEVNGMAVNNPDITIGFNPQSGFLGGFLGCNNVTARFDINEEPGELELDEMEMLGDYVCADAQLETMIYRALDEVDEFQVSADGKEAQLLDDDKAILVKLRKVSDQFVMELKSEPAHATQTMAVVSETIDRKELEGEWDIITIGDLVVADAEDLSNKPTIVFDITKLAFSGNASCNMYNGRIEFDDPRDTDFDAREIEFESVGATRMACENMTVESALFKALDEVDSFGRLDDGSVVFYDGEVVVLKIQRP